MDNILFTYNQCNNPNCNCQIKIFKGKGRIYEALSKGTLTEEQKLFILVHKIQLIK